MCKTKTNYKLKNRKHYYKERTFWSDGYFVCGISVGASYETIQKYISSQKVAAIPMLS